MTFHYYYHNVSGTNTLDAVGYGAVGRVLEDGKAFGVQNEYGTGVNLTVKVYIDDAPVYTQQVDEAHTNFTVYRASGANLTVASFGIDGSELYVKFTAPVETPVSSSSEPETSTHEHNWEYVTLTETTEICDGTEGYRCSICGATKDEASLSAYGYACRKAQRTLAAAKAGQTVTIDMKMWNSYPKWLMEDIAAAANNNVTTVVKFDYQHKHYVMTIPALSKVDTSCDWYGPLKLMSLYSVNEQ